MADMKTVLDTIRANASIEYKERIPVATQENITSIGNTILTYSTLQNDFLTGLVNRIAMTMIHNKTAVNPLSVLKKGKVPLGSDIQEIFTNMASGTTFDPSGSKLLTRTTPDVKSIYHRLNRQDQYPVTISRQQLQTAFIDFGKLEEQLNNIVTSLYSGDNFDEFILTKNLFAQAILNNKVVQLSVGHVKDEASGKAFVKAVKNASSNMAYPSSNWNSYFANKPTTDAGKPVTTWTPQEDQIIIIRSDVVNEIDVEVLASAFNLSKLEFMARKLEVDSFGGATNCLAILCDKSWVQVYDNLYEMSSFQNGQGLYWNYWLNHWQTYSLSMFANAVAFICDSEAISIDKTTLTFTTTATQTITATTTPADATVEWISSNENVATVVDGVVTPVDDGVCYINAVNGDAVSTCKVTVTLA